ncbi:MAG: hypothetical protein L0Y68_10145 [Candidatus Dadabacteria bacterium]|nr:hypothetical protein [Candidatus Dadabacteria bacterium]
MPRRAKIAWDISHLEFTIEDHYYFSILKFNIKKAGALVKEVYSFKDITDYDIVVLNYPEKPFNKDETALVKKYLEEGGKVITCGYYNNEDKIADNVNSLSSHFGLILNGDKVRDKSSNDNRDDLLIVTSRVLSYNDPVKKILFPCPASIVIRAHSVKPIVLLENPSNSKKDRVIGAEAQVGRGRFLLLGTCVFWDNFAIKKYDNLKFSLNLLLK